jgi:1-phosphofructokinase
MAAHIVTVTLNPAIDEAVTLDGLWPGEVHRARGVAFHAGGKGVNVASCLADFGFAPVAAGFLGAGNDGVFRALFAAKGIGDAFIRVAGETRTNIKLLHEGETTDINLPGVAVDADGLAELVARLRGMVTAETILLLAGSLPAGLEDGVYGGLIAALRPTGTRIFLDTSGAPLSAVLRGDALPDCIKPNRAELEAFCGRGLPTTGDVIEAARMLRGRGIGLVVVSMGAEGAVFVGERVLRARLPAMRVENTVGAGDAMVAGLIAAAARGADLETTARLATAFAAGKLGRAGPNLPGRETIEALAAKVEIVELEGTRS